MTDITSNFSTSLEQADAENANLLQQIEDIGEARRQRMARRSASVEPASERRSARERILQESQARQSPRRTRAVPRRSASFNLSDTSINLESERDSFRQAFEEVRTSLFGNRQSNTPVIEAEVLDSPVISRRGSDNAISSRYSSSSTAAPSAVTRSRQAREQLDSSFDLQAALTSAVHDMIPTGRRSGTAPRYPPRTNPERPVRYARRVLGINDQDENSSEASDSASVGDSDRISDTGSDRGSASDLRTSVLRNRHRSRGTRYQSDLTSLSTFLSTPRTVDVNEDDALPVLGMAEKLPFVDSKGKTRWISRSLVNHSGILSGPVNITNKSKPARANGSNQPGPSEVIASESEDPQERFENLREMLYKNRYNKTDNDTNGDSPDGQTPAEHEVKPETQVQKQSRKSSKSSNVEDEEIEIDEQRFPSHLSFYIKPRSRPSLEIYKASRVRHDSDSDLFGSSDDIDDSSHNGTQTHTAETTPPRLPPTSTAGQYQRIEVNVEQNSVSQSRTGGYGPVLSPIQSPRLLHQQSSTGEVISEADMILDQLEQMHINAELPLDTSHLDLDELRMIQMALEESATPLQSPTGSEMELNNNQDNPDHGNNVANTNDNSLDEFEVFEVTEEVMTLTPEQMAEIHHTMRRYSFDRLSSTTSNH